MQILAVVSAKNELDLQKVTKLTRKLDPDGGRTVGIITKPDELRRGSDRDGFSLHLRAMKISNFAQVGISSRTVITTIEIAREKSVTG